MVEAFGCRTCVRRASMNLCRTVVFLVTVLVTTIRAAVPSHPTDPPSSAETQIVSHVQPADLAEMKPEFTNWPEGDLQIGCKELRAKRYISDGFCTSLKAIKEVVCAGHCMPLKEQDLPWWSEFTKYWAKPKFMEWRCVENITKLKKVQLQCGNGETRHYKIKIVKSCRCKSYEREPNRTDDLITKRTRVKRKNDKEQKRKEKQEKRKQRRLKKQREREMRRKLRKGKKRNRSKSKDGPLTERRRHSSRNKDDKAHNNSQRHTVATNESPDI